MAKKNTPETGHPIGHFGGNEAETLTKSVSASMLHAHSTEKNVSKNLIFYTNCGIGTMRHFCNTLSFTIFAGQTVKPIRAAGESVLGFARRTNCGINCVSAGQSSSTVYATNCGTVELNSKLVSLTPLVTLVTTCSWRNNETITNCKN